MVWRIAVLTDIPTDPETAPADPLDEVAVPQVDLHLIETRNAPAPISRARILELNAQASDYFASLYPRSWAPEYLRSRIRTDLFDDPRFVVGYAPPGPTSLIRHLVDLGADEHELVNAGLARRTERGHLVDAFKDRLLFPIREGDGIVGFIGRRNPTKDDTE
jgi:DNA primase